MKNKYMVILNTIRSKKGKFYAVGSIYGDFGFDLNLTWVELACEEAYEAISDLKPLSLVEIEMIDFQFNRPVFSIVDSKPVEFDVVFGK